MLKRFGLVTLSMVGAALVAVSAVAADTDVVTRRTTTPEPGAVRDEGGYSKTEVVPHQMRATDPAEVRSNLPGPGSVNDQGTYVKSVDVPHKMPAQEQHIQSSTPGPGMTQDQGAYHNK